ncbi:c-type cytochrome [Roseococcus sp. DSY-14]|uniref:c-type cytochrome n=1 Tax=Roseococcus sp. DSY-14 TaxID=3369650 RepID=UPI00387A9BFA
MRRARWLPLLLLLLAACDGWGASDPPPAPAEPPEGAIPQGHAARRAALAPPGPPVDAALLAEGAEAWRVFCAACHGPGGAGDGVVRRHGHPPIPPVPRDAGRAMAALAANLAGAHPVEGRMDPRQRWAAARFMERLPP